MRGLLKVSEAQSAGAKITIAGNQGVGKTTLAALFPNPIVIQIEDGLRSISESDAMATPKIKTSAAVNQWLDRLATEDHDRRTVILDTVSELDSMIEDEILTETKADSLAQAYGGYGAGLRVAADRMRAVHGRASKLASERGMIVIAVAHTAIKQISPEDGTPHDVLTLRLNTRSIYPWIDQVDMVAVLRLVREMQQAGDKREIAVSGGAREIICHANVASVAKNRYGVTDIIPVPEGQNPLLEIISGNIVAPAEKPGQQEQRKEDF